MIQLYQFAPAWRLNASPFCMKVETYCRLAAIPYSVQHTLPFKGPRGKLPFIVDGSQCIPDSENIIDYLKSTCGDPLDGGLSPSQRAMGHLLRQVCEESLYFVLLYSRWMDDVTWPKVREVFFGALPPVLRNVVPALVRRGIRKSLMGQGYGRYPEPELYRLAAADLAALAWQLEQNRFAVGESVTSFDATLYAFLYNILRAPLETPLKAAAMEFPALDAYISRVDKVLASRAT